jgi:hypothetical protein
LPELLEDDHARAQHACLRKRRSRQPAGLHRMRDHVRIVEVAFARRAAARRRMNRGHRRCSRPAARRTMPRMPASRSRSTRDREERRQGAYGPLAGADGKAPMVEILPKRTFDLIITVI